MARGGRHRTPAALALLLAIGLNAGGGLALYAEKFGAASGYDIGVHALWGLQYYLMGFALAPAYAFLRALRRPVWTGATGALALVAWVAHVQSTEGAPSGALAQYAYIGAVCLPFVAGGVRSRGLESLGRESMGIYLLHTPILMSLFHRAMTRMIPDGITHFVLLTVVDLAATWVLVLALGRIPGARAILFGEPARTGARPGP